VTLKGETIAEEFQELVEDYVRSRYGEGGRLRRAAEDKPRTIVVKAVV